MLFPSTLTFTLMVNKRVGTRWLGFTETHLVFCWMLWKEFNGDGKQTAVIQSDIRRQTTSATRTNGQRIRRGLWDEVREERPEILRLDRGMSHMLSTSCLCVDFSGGQGVKKNTWLDAIWSGWKTPPAAKLYLRVWHLVHRNKIRTKKRHSNKPCFTAE